MSRRTQTIQELGSALNRTKARTVQEQEAQVQALCCVLATTFLAMHHLSPDWIEDLANEIRNGLDEYKSKLESPGSN